MCYPAEQQKACCQAQRQSGDVDERIEKVLSQISQRDQQVVFYHGKDENVFTALT